MVRLFIFLFAVHCSLLLNAQCINAFPYVEDFEANIGGWASGGSVGVDWAWGSPTKSVINSAGSGVKCWITGGLASLAYNAGERSFVKSPCFDFTTLQHPFVSFKIFWESEKTYDGTNLQYSLDGGITWTNLGSASDAVDCMNTNWFNSFSITNLTGLAIVKEGWTGNVQPTSGSCQGGSGSGAWVTAKHCMQNLAGEPNVIFRFTFGAGTTCNNYDGIAFDDVSVSEAPANTADFDFTCNGNSLLFNGITSFCPDNLQWNFGDGTNASGPNAVHTFSSPGNYNVTFSVSGPCNAPASITKQVEVTNASVASVNVNCNGNNDGKAFVTSATGTGPFTYFWSTTPAQTTDTAFNLTSGVYIVTISQPNSCPASFSVNVNEPNALSNSIISIPDSCNSGKGSLLVTESGGTFPYQYLWSNGTGGVNQLTNLFSGNYAVTITDANGCVDVAQTVVANVTAMNISVVSLTDASCFGTTDGGLSVNVTGGILPYQYLWSPSGGTSNTITNVAAGIYTIQISDSTNCLATASFTINQPPQLFSNFSVIDATCGLNNGSIHLNTSGGVSPYNYLWNDGTTNDSMVNIGGGNYSFTITDANNCSINNLVAVQQSQSITFNLLSIPDSCLEGKGTAQINIFTGTAPYHFVWNPSAPDAAIITQLDSGNYFVHITDASGCSADTNILVGNFGSIVKPNLGADSSFCLPPNFILYAGNYSTYQWQSGSTIPIFPVKDVGEYSVTVTNSFGCTSADTVVLSFNCDSYINFPSAFSPNADGVNDVFRAKYSLDLVKYNLRIYNRWGELVFETSDVNEGWDGTFNNKPQPLSVYVWYAEYSFRDGKKNSKAGNLTLVK